MGFVSRYNEDSDSLRVTVLRFNMRFKWELLTGTVRGTKERYYR